MEKLARGRGLARRGWAVALLLLVTLLQSLGQSAPAQAAEVRQSQQWLNTGTALDGWQTDGTHSTGTALQLDPAHLRSGHDPYPAGSFHGGNYYNGGNYYYGEALAPYYSPAGGFDSAIASWDVQTPAHTWVELRLRALIGQTWTREYTMGVWSSDGSTIRRHSVNFSDGNGQVDTDTLNLKSRASAFQVRAVLFTTDPNATPNLTLAGVNTVRNGGQPGLTSNRAAWGVNIAVPERSQMIYPDGGEVWCSPTSSSMVLAYWATKGEGNNLNQTVPTAADHTYDWIYDGNGNWPFNTAWAASVGAGSLESYVTRFVSLTQVEEWITKGVPVIVSIAYAPGQLAGTPIPASNGHLLVVRGFDRAGNVITNDPAADPRRGQATQIVYNRAQFEQRWLTTSGGAAYLIYPTHLKASLPIGNAAQPFADPSIEAIWGAADRGVGGGSNRSWLWGPGPNGAGRLEQYAEGPNGQRLVQYFDKSRMEITRPSGDRNASWFVTNGLLTVELVTGQLQMGDNAFESHSPASIPVAGDPNSPNAPTYATFRNLASVEGHQGQRRAPNRLGQAVTDTLNRDGQSFGPHAPGVTVAQYEPTLGHNIPAPFWSWMNDPTRSGLTIGWLFALGYPISEPYWVQINLNGQPKTVLVQLFERRALTYTPNNPAAFQIEMGNIGQHYQAWRYGG